MAILFDITFVPGTSAIGAFLEYRPLHPSGPSGLIQYPWVTNINTPGADVIGYFPITSNPMVLDDVPGMFPDFQENTSYEFRIKQLCADGTELYSPVDGTYMVPNCDRFSQEIVPVPIQQGPFGIAVYLFYRPLSSISSYTVYLRNFNNVIATHTVSYTQMDTSGNNPYTYVFTNNDLTPPEVFISTGGYSLAVEITVQTSSGPLVITNCNTVAVKSPGCSSYDVNVGDQWGMQWYDCVGGYHDCYSQFPYLFDGLQVPIRLCALGTPNLYYCDGQTFVDGSIVDPITGNVQQGGEATLVSAASCLPGYSDFQLGLTDPFGFPIPCVPNPTCGPSNLIIINQCVAPADFDGTSFRNGDPIPEVPDPLEWSNLTTPAWSWVNNVPGSPFGKLYNWYAIMDSRNIAPIGYHVPTVAEWTGWVQDMIDAGKSPNDLRVDNDLYWDNNIGATDFYGFSAYGSGRRYLNGNMLNFKTSKWYWVDNSINPLISQWAYLIFTASPPSSSGYGFHPSTFPAALTGDQRQGMSLRLFCD
jgi:uncharacterized protein (TIGR02145 family)